MKVGEKIKRLLRRQPPNLEKLAARAEAEVRRAQAEGDATAGANNMAGPYGSYSG